MCVCVCVTPRLPPPFCVSLLGRIEVWRSLVFSCVLSVCRAFPSPSLASLRVCRTIQLCACVCVCVQGFCWSAGLTRLAAHLSLTLTTARRPYQLPPHSFPSLSPRLRPHEKVHPVDAHPRFSRHAQLLRFPLHSPGAPSHSRFIFSASPPLLFSLTSLPRCVSVDTVPSADAENAPSRATSTPYADLLTERALVPPPAYGRGGRVRHWSSPLISFLSCLLQSSLLTFASRTPR